MSDGYHTAYRIVTPPPVQCILHVTDGFRVEMTHQMPSCWTQFWHWWFFGFKWEKV